MVLQTTGYLFTEFFSDMTLVLKIFVLLSIWDFVKQRIGNNFLAAIILIGAAWFILFDMFWFFGGIYILIMLGMLGVSNLLIDFYFVGGGSAIKGLLRKVGIIRGGKMSRPPGQPPKIESPVSSAVDLQKRQQQLRRNQSPATKWGRR